MEVGELPDGDARVPLLSGALLSFLARVVLETWQRPLRLYVRVLSHPWMTIA